MLGINRTFVIQFIFGQWNGRAMICRNSFLSSSLNRISILNGSISDELMIVVVVAPEFSLSVLDSVNVKIPSLFDWGFCVVPLLPSSLFVPFCGSNDGRIVVCVLLYGDVTCAVVRIKGGVVDENIASVVSCSLIVVVVVGVDAAVVTGVVVTIDLVLV